MSTITHNRVSNRTFVGAGHKFGGALACIDRPPAGPPPSGMGRLPPARPPHASKKDSRYEDFCTDWFMSPHECRESVNRRE